MSFLRLPSARWPLQLDYVWGNWLIDRWILDTTRKVIVKTWKQIGIFFSLKLVSNSIFGLIWHVTNTGKDLDHLVAMDQPVHFLRFKFSTLEKATDCFNETHKLGSGGYGEIFKVCSKSFPYYYLYEKLNIYIYWHKYQITGKLLSLLSF